MDLAAFESLLKESMGLDAGTIGISAIERAVRERMLATGENDPAKYFSCAQSSSPELQELIEAVIVPETWFFRDSGAFTALVSMAAEWMVSHRDGTFRLLSVPCSTGEEPYSMAMALLDAGIPRDRFRVDAVDISTRSIAIARRGIYGRNSFRGEQLSFRDRFFESEGNLHRLNERVRVHVCFRQGNLLERSFTPPDAPFDVVFCRNLLIYFDGPTQAQAVEVLMRWLALDGILFVGPSETGLLLEKGLLSARIPLAFAFRKPGAAGRESQNEKAERPIFRSLPKPIRSEPVAPPPRSISPRKAERSPPRQVQPAASSEKAGDEDLNQVARLADHGRLEEARKCCAEHLKKHGPSARVFYLSGLVRDASGEVGEAAEFYRKAIYLDPGYQEALVHLAALLEQQGDKPGAAILYARARRAAPEKKR